MGGPDGEKVLVKGGMGWAGESNSIYSANSIKAGHYVICGHCKRLIGCYEETTSLLVTIVPCVEEVRGQGRRYSFVE